MIYESYETHDDLDIIQRTDGKWLVEDTTYRVTIGPYATREAAKAWKDREIARRLEAIRQERGT